MRFEKGVPVVLCVYYSKFEGQHEQWVNSQIHLPNLLAESAVAVNEHLSEEGGIIGTGKFSTVYAVKNATIIARFETTEGPYWLIYGPDDADVRAQATRIETEGDSAYEILVFPEGAVRKRNWSGGS